mmetsp:Transcript_8192/g.9611  ORF Transcript_8192/g.9611 Transcript_8192/m.9611 type:complete len:118 (-) Transcript_8192:502-855(-)
MQFWAQIKFLLPRQKRASGTFDIFSLRIFHYFLYRSHQNRNFDNTLPLHYIHFQKYPSTDQQPCRRLTQTVILPPFCPLSVTLSFVSSSFFPSLSSSFLSSMFSASSLNLFYASFHR